MERVAEEHRARGRTGEHWRVYPRVGWGWGSLGRRRRRKGAGN